MFALMPNQRWTPMDQSRWSLRAFGRDVMLESSGGMLSADFNLLETNTALLVQGRIVGRMLIEAYCNGEQVLSDLRSNEDFEIALDLAEYRGEGPAKLEVQFIPATYGEVRIPRSISTNPKSAQAAPFDLGCATRELART